MADSAEENIRPTYSEEQKRIFKGFSEELYGNNWFVLSTNDGNSMHTMCGILDQIPKLNFSTTVSSGPQQVVTDLISNTLTGRGSLAQSVGSALGANLNVQISGNYTKRVSTEKSFQDGGFSLTFTCWKRPQDLFDPSCIPSSQRAVIDYLGKYATVDTVDQFTSMLDKTVDQAMSAVGSVIPIATEAASRAGKILFGDDQDKSRESSDLIDTISKFGEAVSAGADTVLVRGWNDKQRITIGRKKMNEPLHRLDILRAGVLNTYLIVAVKSWSYELDQSSLGEKMKVTLNCSIDQRMNGTRLRTYKEDKSIFAD